MELGHMTSVAAALERAKRPSHREQAVLDLTFALCGLLLLTAINWSLWWLITRTEIIEDAWPVGTDIRSPAALALSVEEQDEFDRAVLRGNDTLRALGDAPLPPLLPDMNQPLWQIAR